MRVCATGYKWIKSVMALIKSHRDVLHFITEKDLSICKHERCKSAEISVQYDVLCFHDISDV